MIIITIYKYRKNRIITPKKFPKFSFLKKPNIVPLFHTKFYKIMQGRYLGVEKNMQGSYLGFFIKNFSQGTTYLAKWRVVLKPSPKKKVACCVGGGL